MNYSWIIQPMVLYLTFQSLHVLAVIFSDNIPDGKRVHDYSDNTLLSLSEEEDETKGGQNICRRVAAVIKDVSDSRNDTCDIANPIADVSRYGEGTLRMKFLMCHCKGQTLKQPKFYVRRRLGVIQDQYYVLYPVAQQRNDDNPIIIVCNGIYHISRNIYYKKVVPKYF